MNKRPEVVRAAQVAVLAAPVVFVAIMGWIRRWATEDAFIDFRVVAHILAGNGPVFNADERVEAFTSPLWVALLSVFGGLSKLGFPASLEAFAVGLGLLFSVAAFAVGTYAAARLHGAGRRDRLLVPAGVLAVAGLSGMWDFLTSGLETGLVFFWLALTFAAVVRVALREDGSPSWWPFVLAGLGPVVRPDLGLFAICFLVALVVLGRPWSWSRIAGRVGAAVAIPLAYEIFRAGYYASLVPNTALAKEAGASSWRDGRSYLADFVRTYDLWIPAALCLVVVLLVARDQRAAPLRNRRAVAAASALVGGLLSTVYVVRVGGDFMHARMLLPPTFALCLPLFVVPLGRWTAAPVAALGAYAVAAAVALGPGFPITTSSKIVNERAFWAHFADVGNPITLRDYRTIEFYRLGEQLRTLARRRPDARVAAVPVGIAGFQRYRGVRREVVVLFGAIGVFGYASGTHVHVVDRIGLSDPIAGRMEVGPRGRPGHEKSLPLPLFFGRWVASSPDPSIERSIVLGRAALACPRMRRLLHAVEEPLSVGRFFGNIARSWTFTRMRIPRDPAGWRCPGAGRS